MTVIHKTKYPYVVRIRRSWDDAERDIGLSSGGQLDERELVTFVGNGDGFVCQTAAKDGTFEITQPTAGLQFPLVKSGIITIGTSGRRFARNLDEVLLVSQMPDHYGIFDQTEVSILSKSAIVLIVASLQKFVADLLEESFFALHPDSVWSNLPQNCQQSLSDRARNRGQDVLEQFSKSQLRDLLVEWVKAKTNPLPGPKNLDKQFKELLGVEDLTDTWPHRQQLEELMELRNLIAHEVGADLSVNVTFVEQSIRLAAIVAEQCSVAAGSRVGGIEKWGDHWTPYRIVTHSVRPQR